MSMKCLQCQCWKIRKIRQNGKISAINLPSWSTNNLKTLLKLYLPRDLLKRSTSYIMIISNFDQVLQVFSGKTTPEPDWTRCGEECLHCLHSWGEKFWKAPVQINPLDQTWTSKIATLLSRENCVNQTTFSKLWFPQQNRQATQRGDQSYNTKRYSVAWKTRRFNEFQIWCYLC